MWEQGDSGGFLDADVAGGGERLTSTPSQKEKTLWEKGRRGFLNELFLMERAIKGVFWGISRQKTD
jgi:hypothetical protein